MNGNGNGGYYAPPQAQVQAIPPYQSAAVHVCFSGTLECSGARPCPNCRDLIRDQILVPVLRQLGLNVPSVAMRVDALLERAWREWHAALRQTPSPFGVCTVMDVDGVALILAEVQLMKQSGVAVQGAWGPQGVQGAEGAAYPQQGPPPQQTFRYPMSPEPSPQPSAPQPPGQPGMPLSEAMGAIPADKLAEMFATPERSAPVTPVTPRGPSDAEKAGRMTSPLTEEDIAMAGGPVGGGEASG